MSAPVSIDDMLESNQIKEREKEENEALLDSVNSSELERVLIDGLALLKIIQHAERGDNNNLSGFLLGADFSTELEVTDTFVFNDETYNGEKFDNILLHLREINCDNRQIGWYQIMDSNSSYLSSTIILDQLTFQRDIPRSTLIVYDPIKTLTERRLYLKAYHLTKEFLESFKGDDFSKEPISITQKFDELLSTVPISIRNPEIVSCYLRLYAKPNEIDFNLNSIFESNASAIEQDLNYLYDSASVVLSQQERVLSYKKSIKKRMQQNGDVSNYIFPAQQDFLLALCRTSSLTQELKDCINEEQIQSDIFIKSDDVSDPKNVKRVQQKRKGRNN